MSFSSFASWGKIEPQFLFSNIVTSKVLCPIMTNSSFWLFFAVKGETFCTFHDFQGPQPKFKDFPGLGIFSCQFQDFPWQPWKAFLFSIYKNWINCHFWMCSFKYFLFFKHWNWDEETYDRALHVVCLSIPAQKNEVFLQVMQTSVSMGIDSFLKKRVGLLEVNVFRGKGKCKRLSLEI